MTSIYEMTTTEVRYDVVVPVAEPYGAAVVEVQRAIEWAARRFAELHDGAVPGSDDWARVHITDDSVIVRISEHRTEARR